MELKKKEREVLDFEVERNKRIKKWYFFVKLLQNSRL